MTRLETELAFSGLSEAMSVAAQTNTPRKVGPRAARQKVYRWFPSPHN